MTRLTTPGLALCALLAGLAFPSPAAAQERATPTSEREAPRAAFLHVDGATAPAVGTSVGTSSVTVTDLGSGSRAFASDLARAGAVYTLGAETSLTPWLSFTATGLTDAPSADLATASGVTAGVRLTPLSVGPTRMSITVGALRELSGGTGTFARLALARDFGRTRVAVSAHGEHVVTPGRDAIDVMVSAGASYAVSGPFRLGVEYVGQDLEGALDPTELEGVRHFVGPTASIELFDRRVSVVAGPAAGLSYGSPRAVGRMAIVYAF